MLRSKLEHWCCFSSAAFHMLLRTFLCILLPVLAASGAEEAGKFALHDAARRGDTGAVKILLQEGYDPNANPSRTATPLCCAVFGKNLEITKMLVEAGANVNASPELGLPPLHLAVMKHDLPIVTFLIEKGADVNLAGRETGWTPLHFAAREGESEMVVFLIERGANVNAQSRGESREAGSTAGFTPLHLAANLAVSRILLEKGAKPDAADEMGRNPLFFAKDADSAELMISKGADVNQNGKYGATPLCYAAACGRSDVAEVLIDQGAQVEPKSCSDGRTPLFYAVKGWYRGTMDLLVKRGAKVANLDKETRELYGAVVRITDKQSHYPNPSGITREDIMHQIQSKIEPVLLAQDPATTITWDKGTAQSKIRFHVLPTDTGKSRNPPSARKITGPDKDGFVIRLGFGHMPFRSLLLRPTSAPTSNVRKDLPWESRYRGFELKGWKENLCCTVDYGSNVPPEFLQKIEQSIEAACRALPVRGVANPVEDYGALRGDMSEGLRVFESRVQDLNNDGIEDVLLADFRFFGNGGGAWYIYLGSPDHRFFRLASAELGWGPRDFLPVKKGIGEFSVHHAMGGNASKEIRYQISDQGLKPLWEKSTDPTGVKRERKMEGESARDTR